MHTLTLYLSNLRQTLVHLCCFSRGAWGCSQGLEAGRPTRNGPVNGIAAAVVPGAFRRATRGAPEQQRASAAAVWPEAVRRGPWGGKGRV